MRNIWKQFMIGGLLLLAVASCGRRVELEEELGFRDEARRNPFLAAERFLQKRGYLAESRLRLDDVPATDHVVVAGVHKLTTMGSIDEVETWIYDGGHLICFLAGDEYQPWLNGILESEEPPDWHGGRAKSIVEEPHPFLDLLEIRIGASFVDTEVSIEVDEETMDIWVPAPVSFRLGDYMYPDILAGDEEAASVASMTLGEGRLTLLTDASLFRSRHIAKQDHAAFLLGLIELDREPERIWLVYGRRLSFFGMLWQHAWMVVLAAAVLLAFWLWHVMPRFGPRLPDESPSTRSFIDHLRVSSRFLWRQGCAEHLLDPVRRRVAKAYQTRFGHSIPDWRDASWHAALAKRSGLAVERVRRAFLAPVRNDSHAFTRTVQDLQHIESTL